MINNIDQLQNQLLTLQKDEENQKIPKKVQKSSKKFKKVKKGLPSPEMVGKVKFPKPLKLNENS